MQPDEWKFTITVHGVQFVMITGALTMLVLCVGNLVFVKRSMHIEVLIMVRELGRFCWTMLTVRGLSHHYFCADILDWKITTVVTVKTLASDVDLQVKN